LHWDLIPGRKACKLAITPHNVIIMNLNVYYNTASLKRLNSNSVVPAETTIKATIAIAAADIFPFKLPTVKEPNVAELFRYKTTT